MKQLERTMKVENKHVTTANTIRMAMVLVLQEILRGK